MKHTKTPWRLIEVTEYSDTSYIVEDSNEETLLSDTTYENQAPDKETAALIVKCVNLHGELVKALDDLINEINELVLLDDSNELHKKVSKYKDLLTRIESEPLND